MGLFVREMLAITFVVALCFVRMSLAQQNTSTEPDAKVAAARSPAGSPARGSHTGQLLIGEGDLVEVKIFGMEDYQQEARVDSYGAVALPLIGSVHIAGLTPEAAQNLVAEKLVQGRFYKNPQVLVFVKEYGSGGVYMMGEVQKPGFYPLTNFRTLLEAISVAGGTTPRAGTMVTITNEKRPQHTVTVTLADSSKPSEAGSDENLRLIPGDSVQVAKAGMAFVVGDVKVPAGIVMEHRGLTVLGALAMAQGANSTASLKNARLIRRRDGKPEEMPLALNNILAAKAPDVTLEPDDILFIPRNDGLSVLKKVGETALQMSMGAVLYRY
jgi:polysaccharide export outer membrane protein